MACWHPGRLDEAFEDIHRMEAEILQLQQELAAQHATTPAVITITPTDQEGNIVTTYAPGQTATFTAVSDNAENQPVADTYTWSTTAGTIVPGADTTTVTISDAPLGDLTVTATDPAGLSGTVTVTIADQTPASVTVTAA
jgi:hypothetical protein